MLSAELWLVAASGPDHICRMVLYHGGLCITAPYSEALIPLAASVVGLTLGLCDPSLEFCLLGELKHAGPSAAC